MPSYQRGENSDLILQTPHNIGRICNSDIRIRHKRASPCFFFRGSLTLETAMVLPIVLCAVAALLYLFALLSIQARKEENQMAAARMMACTVGTCSTEDPYVRLTLPWYASLPYSGLFPKGKLLQNQTVLRAWVGFTGENFSREDVSEMVYVTESGTVFHKDHDCTYLSLSIHSVSGAAVSTRRNESGGKYDPCEYCAKGSRPANVYITNYGSSYHYDRNCQGLKRTIRAIPLAEAGGMKACSKCGY